MGKSEKTMALHTNHYNFYYSLFLDRILIGDTQNIFAARFTQVKKPSEFCVTSEELESYYFELILKRDIPDDISSPYEVTLIVEVRENQGRKFCRLSVHQNYYKGVKTPLIWSRVTRVSKEFYTTRGFATRW